MPVSCVAIGCTNRYTSASERRFYLFPSDKARQKAWVQALRRIDFPPSGGIRSWHRVCSDHFVSGKKSDDPYSESYIPTLFSFTPKEHATRSSTRKCLARLAAHAKRNARKRLAPPTPGVNSCWAINCKSVSDPTKLFALPSDEPRRTIWLRNAGREDLITSPPSLAVDFKLCRHHFEKSQFDNSSKSDRTLVPLALPTIFEHLKKKDAVDSGGDDEDCRKDGRSGTASGPVPVYKNFEELRSDAYQLAADCKGWHVLEDTPSQIIVGLLDGLQTFLAIAVSSSADFSAEVAVYGIPRRASDSLRYRRLSEFVDEISLMSVCLGVDDPDLQCFAELPDAKSDFFRHVTYSTRDGAVVYRSSVLSVECERLIKPSDSPTLLCDHCGEVYDQLKNCVRT